ncbi:hypothetical protein MRB53_034393 [Persea americana]|uniref:Uncharacterized protein n=1 Tax=Persea americana TaxID=3435 RepID=A0ACC2K1Q0_PERAE|nr:hypothetical protein MRB53_034393 [Persea americana]
MSLCLINIKIYMELHHTTNSQSRFRHQILTEPNKNYKIFQSSQKKGTHEVSGHYDTIWPNFNPPTAEPELPTATVSKTSNLRSEPMDGLKIPPKGSMSNFKSNRHRLHVKFQVIPTTFDPVLKLRSKIKPTGGEAPRDHGTQIRANGSSQNDSSRLPVKFQVNRTSDDRTSKLDIFRTVKSSQASTGPQTASKLK